MRRSGVGSNLQVGDRMLCAGRKKILMCPQFSLVPPHEGGTTIVCYRLWETIEVSPFIVSALQSAHLLVKSGEGQ